jgi:hypothetical protein
MAEPQALKIPIGFRCYVKNGKDIIDEWKQTISKKGRVNFDVVLTFLKDQPKANWNRPKAASIGNNIYVIHFKDESRKQYRPCGNFLDSHNSFVITTPVIEKGGNYDPSTYEDIANTRKTEVLSDPNRYSTPCFTHISVPCIATDNNLIESSTSQYQYPSAMGG